MIRSFVLLTAVASFLFLTPVSLHAQCNEIIYAGEDVGQFTKGMLVRTYDSKKHWRFHYLNDRDFIGEAYGWTGGFEPIGRMVPQSPESGCSTPKLLEHLQLRWVTMLTSSFGLTAMHVATAGNDPCMEAVAPGRDVRFYLDNDPCGNNFVTQEIRSVFRVGDTDLAVVQFKDTVNVGKFRLGIPASGTTFSGQLALIVGRDVGLDENHLHRVVDQRFGTNTIKNTGLITSVNGHLTLAFRKPYSTTPDPNDPDFGDPNEVVNRTGDSGAPNFLFTNGGMYLIGITQFPERAMEVYSYYTEIQDIIQATGSTEILSLVTLSF